MSVLYIFCSRWLKCIRSGFFISPLLCCKIEPACRVLLTRRPLPVFGECYMTPALTWTDFCLSDIVGPARAVSTDHAPQHDVITKSSVNGIGVQPRVHAS